MVKNREINGTEEIALVTPTRDEYNVANIVEILPCNPGSDNDHLPSRHNLS